LLFILPEIELLENYSGGSLSLVLMGIAISLYTYATGGFVPQAGLDKNKEQFWVCKLKSKGQARIVTYYDRTYMQGLFIRRPSASNKNAALCVRSRGETCPGHACLRQSGRYHRGASRTVRSVTCREHHISCKAGPEGRNPHISPIWRCPQRLNANLVYLTFLGHLKKMYEKSSSHV
jgi:hypothetical protein